MFGRKKTDRAEEERLRNERIASVADRLKTQIMTIGTQKNTLLAKVVEARRKGLTAQEEQARGLLRRTMAAEKRANGMLMTLELFVQSRDLAELNRQFLEAIGSLSKDIAVSVSKSDAKSAERQYMRALYASDRQTRALDEMLEVGNYGAALVDSGETYSEFDDEIDKMVSSAESAAPRTKQTL